MNKKHKRGQSIIELVIGLMVLVPIVLLIFDLAVLVLGVQQNDSICREAARVAAAGDPTKANDLQDRANAVVTRANNNTKGMLSNFKLISVNTNPSQAAINTQIAQWQVPPPGSGNTGGPITGTVTVDTEVDIKPFLVKYAYNGQTLTFRSRQSFPFTYVVPNTAQP